MKRSVSEIAKAAARRALKPSRNGVAHNDGNFAGNQFGDAYEDPRDRVGASTNNSDLPDLPDDQLEEWEQPIPLAEIAAVPAFPVDVFPGPLKQFATEAARAIGCPIDFVAAPMLTIAGGAIGASRALEIKKGFIQRALIYQAIVGLPGDGKTPALDTAAKPVYQAQQKSLQEFQQATERYQEEKARHQQAKKDSRNSPDLKISEEPKKPHLHRVQVDDITVEALAKILTENSRGVVMIRDELSAWITSTNQYKGGKGSDRQFYLKNWAGVPATVDRKQQDSPMIIPHPFVAVVGGIQPELLNCLREEKGRADGFIDRILFAFPDYTPAPEWTWDEIPEEIIAPWQQTLQELLALNQEPTDKGMRPHIIRLTHDARGEWQRLINSIISEQNGESLPSILRGPWSKMKVYAARISLIVHCLRWVTKETDEKNVDAESVRRAAELIRYFQAHARKAYAQMASDPEVEDAKRILQWIEREERSEFKRWEAHKDIKSQGRFPRLEDLDLPLHRLVKHKFLRVRALRIRSCGRPPDPIYEVNPLWNRRVNRVNPASPGSEQAENE